MMDGYVVRLADAGKTVPVTGELAAGQVSHAPLRDGSALEIMTGAPCPPGTEAVVPKEESERTGQQVQLPSDIAPGQHIASMGGECAEGAEVLKEGACITPLAIAVLATFGIETVQVFPPPAVAVITTGNELVEPGQAPGRAQIRDTNGPMLAALARSSGIETLTVLHAGDTLEALSAVLEQTEHADIVMFAGGVSAGKYDLVPKALEAHGATIVLHKVTQKPGKPLLFATKGPRLFFGLPGNPLSCHVCFHRYVAAAIRKMTGCVPTAPQDGGRLTDAITVTGSRTVFQLARVEPGHEGWQVTPLLGKGSADVFAPATANALVRLEPAVGEYPAGATVGFEWTT
jgi:molybdopterin molybdotransferase